MRIQRVELHQVGPFAELALDLPAGTDDTRADVHLLVGANGTGKSTVLAAIAQAFTVADTGFGKRAWGLESKAFVRVFPDATLGMRLHHSGGPPVLSERESGAHIRFAGRMPQWPTVDLFGLNEQRDLAKVGAEWRRAKVLGDVVFAYGGLRSGHGGPVSSVADQPESPLADACVFTRPEGTRPFVQWIANTYAAAAMHEKRGDQALAIDRSTAVHRVQQALEDVMGAPVAFVVDVDPFAVTIRVGDRAPVAVDVLPDGVQSLVSWLGDLLMRLDRIPWATPMPPTERAFVLLLDEVEVHLHPLWQRAVLPMVERLFPKAQIIASTHSPFVIGSAADAWIHRFREVDGAVVVDPPVRGPNGVSGAEILREIMGVPTDFDLESERHLDELRAAISARLRNEPDAQSAIDREVAWLSGRSAELAVIARHELRQLQRQLAPNAAK